MKQQSDHRKRPYFSAFNGVRRVAQQIQHPGFQREYYNAINPVLDAVRNTRGEYDPYFQVMDALKKINRLAVYWQNIPNHIRANCRRPYKHLHGPYDFALLLEVEQLTEAILQKEKQSLIGKEES